MTTDKADKNALRVLPGTNDVWDELMNWQEPANEGTPAASPPELPKRGKPQPPAQREHDPRDGLAEEKAAACAQSTSVGQTARSAGISIEVHSIDPSDIEFASDAANAELLSSNSATSLGSSDLDFVGDDDRHPGHQIKSPGKPNLERRQLMDPKFPAIPNVPDLQIPEPVPPNSGTDATSYAPEPDAEALRSDHLELPANGSSLVSASPLGLAERYSHAPDLSSAPASSPSSTPVHDQLASHEAVRDRYALGDFSGALLLAEQLLNDNPDDREARRYARSCKDVLEKMYTAKLSPLHRIVAPLMSPTEARWLSLDSRAGFVLSLIDGQASVEDVMDMTAMPRLDALKILYELLDRKVIEII